MRSVVVTRASPTSSRSGSQTATTSPTPSPTASTSRIPVAGTVTTLAGKSGVTGSANGQGTSALFNNPQAIAMDAAGAFAVVVDYGNHILRRVNISTGEASTLAGTAGVPGYQDGRGLGAVKFNYATGISMDSAGAVALIGDTSNHLVRRVNISSGEVTTLAGRAGVAGSVDGVGTSASFNRPSDVAMDSTGAFAVVADQGSHIIRRIEVDSGVVSTIAGTPGVAGSSDGTSATFNSPTGACVDAAGAVALVVSACPRLCVRSTSHLLLPRKPNTQQADFNSHLVRRINVSSGVVTTLAGTATKAGNLSASSRQRLSPLLNQARQALLGTMTVPRRSSISLLESRWTLAARLPSFQNLVITL